MPTYNEDPHRLMAGLQAIYESVRDTGQGRAFDFFMLSDTTDADIRRRRSRRFACAARAHSAAKRTSSTGAARDNIERKAGNIADWVRALGRRLSLHAGARRRQPDDRRDHRRAGRGAWSANPTSA